MQPSPSADTVGPSRPSVRSFIGALCTHAAVAVDAQEAMPRLLISAGPNWSTRRE